MVWDCTWASCTSTLNEMHNVDIKDIERECDFANKNVAGIVSNLCAISTPNLRRGYHLRVAGRGFKTEMHSHRPPIFFLFNFPPSSSAFYFLIALP